MISFSSDNNDNLCQAITFLSNRILLLSQFLAVFIQKSFPDDPETQKLIKNFIHVIAEGEGR